MVTKIYLPPPRPLGTLPRDADSITAQGDALEHEFGYCCEAFREHLARLQSWSDSSPPPSLPPSFRGASQHFYSAHEPAVAP